MRTQTATWLVMIVMAFAAIICLLLFFYPKQPDRLVPVEGHERADAWCERTGIFPLSGILFGMSYRCLHLYGWTNTFLVEFALSEFYDPGDELRIWIRPEDYERIQEDPDTDVRVFAADILNPYTNSWTHVVPQHPHGHGAFLAVGIILTVFFLIMVVSQVCFSGSASTGRT